MNAYQKAREELQTEMRRWIFETEEQQDENQQDNKDDTDAS